MFEEMSVLKKAFVPGVLTPPLVSPVSIRLKKCLNSFGLYFSPLLVYSGYDLMIAIVSISL